MRLILSPHVDDDVIGCGGILDGNTTVFYCGVDDFHMISREQRYKEALALQERTGHVMKGCFQGTNHKVNFYDFTDLKDDFEELINEVKPDEVLLPWPSYNQDHQTVYDAAMVALRPHDKNHFVKRVLLYEEPDCFWQPRTPFVPTLFRGIDVYEKVYRYSLMPSQVRSHRSAEAIIALATVRGAACNMITAEAFHILRWIE